MPECLAQVFVKIPNTFKSNRQNLVLYITVIDTETFSMTF